MKAALIAVLVEDDADLDHVQEAIAESMNILNDNEYLINWGYARRGPEVWTDLGFHDEYYAWDNMDWIDRLTDQLRPVARTHRL